MKLIRKKKYKELLDTIKHHEDKIKYLEGAMGNLDNYSCTLRQQKYDLEKDLSYANESYQLLHEDMRRMRELIKTQRNRNIELRGEIDSQKKNNRRLINLLYNPKKK